MAATDTWSLADVPDQAGRTIVVTGPGLGGLGHHTALELARRGGRVVLAGRTPAGLDETAAAIRSTVPAADVVTLDVDLSSFASVRRAGAAAARLGSIDVLVHDAGVTGAPQGARTPDGLDVQLATHHFGPFLLTGLLLPQLVLSGAGTVVTVSSQLHRIARAAPLEDPRVAPRRRRPWVVRGQSRLANLLFTGELDQRCRAAGVPVKALAAHPGLAGNHLAADGRSRRAPGGVAGILDATVRAVSQSAAAGAMPVIMAATADLPGGTYVGPRGPAELAGPPRVTVGSRLARDASAGRELWELSQRTTGIVYP